ncbi:hypothetical protein GTQ34_13425 [Muricauda sp. JGD-17]|uniref:Uncharacterized protein n=1 Tax=Flagellimonas ochracea TaxID=2696472 RepID=A0A964WYK6_9FLAO|nr:hypothetical protein [Allomuricauda ochracea]NAY92918.1 hypothetical protein [Allomuricauda ochracea]
MKSFKTYILLAIGVFMASCSEDDKVTLFVQDNFTAGAVLRTLDQTGGLDMFDEDAELTWSIQEQDIEDGDLLDRVEITLSFVDNNGTTDDSVSGVALATITEFGSTDGLPSFDYSITLGELLTAAGITLLDILPGDQFVVDMELFLTDGRSFDSDSVTGTVEGGSFFSSPFQYTFDIDDGIEFELEDVNANEVSLTNPNEDYAVTIIIGDSLLIDAGLLETLNVYRRFVDRSIEEDGPDLSEDEALFATFDIAADFTVDEEGIATYDYVVTQEALYGDNLTFADLGLNDGFNLRYEIITTDGRSVSLDNENDIGDEYFDPVIVTECIQLNADAPFPGEYTIQFTDTFGDGWDGARFDVTIDDGDTESFTLENGDSGEATFTVPEGAVTLVVEYVPGAYEEEHIFRILDPNGKAAADGGPNPTPGPVELLVCE